MPSIEHAPLDLATVARLIVPTQQAQGPTMNHTDLKQPADQELQQYLAGFIAAMWAVVTLGTALLVLA